MYRGEMKGSEWEARLADCVPPERIKRDAPLAPLTTFKVGGPADWLIDVASVDALTGVLAAARGSAAIRSAVNGARFCVAR